MSALTGEFVGVVGHVCVRISRWRSGDHFFTCADRLWRGKRGVAKWKL